MALTSADWFCVDAVPVLVVVVLVEKGCRDDCVSGLIPDEDDEGSAIEGDGA